MITGVRLSMEMDCGSDEVRRMSFIIKVCKKRGEVPVRADSERDVIC